MFGRLTSILGGGGGPAFGYVPNPISEGDDAVLQRPSDNSMWTVTRGKAKSDGAEVTIFSVDSKTADENQLWAAKNAVKRMKMLRHPNFLRYIDSAESETSIQLATEPVVPLSDALEKDANDLGISWGIHQIAKGIEFLADAFDTIIKMPSSTAKYAAPETRGGGSSGSTKLGAADMWSLGCLIWEVYNGELQRPEALKKVQSIPKKLLEPFVKLISANPRSRPSPTKFLKEARTKGKYLQNSFVDSNLFLDELAIKEPEAKSKFYKDLPASIDRFPQQFCVHKYLPKLLEAFNFGGAGSEVLAPLFKIGKLLSQEDYGKQIVPCIIKLFSSTDRATRINLLQQLAQFIEFIGDDIINNQIFPNVATGFTDTVPAMREQTVKAMLLLVPKLNEAVVDSQLLRHFAKLQMDEVPGIRTNTTVCLGKIACHLSPATRQRVLISAFSRALKDPFTHARVAGVMAFNATNEYYSSADLATKVLPQIAPLTIDPEQPVREQALTLCRAILKKVEESPTDQGSQEQTEAGASSATSASSAAWGGWGALSAVAGGVATAATAAAATAASSMAKSAASAAKSSDNGGSGGGGSGSGSGGGKDGSANTSSRGSSSRGSSSAKAKPPSPKKSPSSSSSSSSSSKKGKGKGMVLGGKKKTSSSFAPKTSGGDGWGSDGDGSAGAGGNDDADDGDGDGDGWGGSDDDMGLDLPSSPAKPAAKKKASGDGGGWGSDGSADWGDGDGGSPSKKDSDGWGGSDDDDMGMDEPAPKPEPVKPAAASASRPKQTADDRKAAREARKKEREDKRAAGGGKPKKGGLGGVKKK